MEELIGTPRAVHSCSLETDQDLENLANNYLGFLKIKENLINETPQYMSFNHFVEFHKERLSKDWAYADNRMGSFQRRKNGYSV